MQGEKRAERAKEKRGLNNEEQGKYFPTKVVYGDVDQELVTELKRSVIGETSYLMESALMEDKLRRVFSSIEKVLALGKYIKF